MQTPVRFYISQNEDRPVVRTIPVAAQAVERDQRAMVEETAAPVVAEHVQHGRVANLVRSAVRRQNAPSK
jgi:hypothetical protein